MTIREVSSLDEPEPRANHSRVALTVLALMAAYAALMGGGGRPAVDLEKQSWCSSHSTWITAYQDADGDHSRAAGDRFCDQLYAQDK